MEPSFAKEDIQAAAVSTASTASESFAVTIVEGAFLNARCQSIAWSRFE